MFITQPAFSRQIRALEERIGVGLVRRSTRRVELTAAGRALLPEARAAVESMERLRRVVRVQSRSVQGRVSVGFMGAMAALPYVQRILERFRDRNPQCTFEMRSLDFVNQFDALTGGEVDAAFLRPPLPPGIRSLQLAVEPRLLCLPAGDPLVSRQPLTLADLSDRVFVDVVGDTMRSWRDDWAVNPRPDGSMVRFGPAVSAVEPLLLVIAQGHGIAFLPAAARDLYPRPGLAYAEVPGVPPTTAVLAWPAGCGESPAVAALREAARSVVG